MKPGLGLGMGWDEGWGQGNTCDERVNRNTARRLMTGRRTRVEVGAHVWNHGRWHLGGTRETRSRHSSNRVGRVHRARY